MLTDGQIKRLKPLDKNKKYPDGGGLYLEVRTTGKKLWKIKYRFNGKENIYSIGEYPHVSLTEARDKRSEVKKSLSDGIDPNQAKRQKLADGDSFNFETIAYQWLETRKNTRDDRETLRRLKHDVFPKIGSYPIDSLTTKIINDEVLDPLILRGVIETAHRCKSLIGLIFMYARSTGKTKAENPTTDLKHSLPKVKRTHFAAITEPEELGQLLRAIYNYDIRGSYTTTAALKLAPMFFLRPSHIRYAKWSEFDLEQGLMFIDAENTKTDQPLIVPMPHQAIEILKNLHPLTGNGTYLFPNRSNNSEPISENTLNAALKYMGYRGQHTAHGFRSTARTILDEVLEIRTDLIEHQLAHAVKDPNGRAYNRTKFLRQRRVMMQKWADYMDALRLNEDTSRFMPNEELDVLMQSLNGRELLELIAAIKAKQPTI